MSDPSSAPSEIANPPQRNKWIYITLFLIVPLCLLVGVYYTLVNSGNSEVRDALAETDRLDPRWRQNEVENDRAAVPPERNSALVVMALKPRLPTKWPAWDHPSAAADPAAETKRTALQESFQKLEPQRQLNTEQIDALQAELKKAEAVIAEARKLAEMPEGRYPIEYKADFINILLPYAQTAREVARILSLAALLRAQEGQADDALASCRAILNAGRSIGDEPLLISQLVRMACRRIAVEQVQRTLAQGEPSEAALRQLQQLLEMEESVPQLLIGLRGERAAMDRFLAAIQSGEIEMTSKEFSALMGSFGPGDNLQLEALAFRIPGFVPSQRAALLRHMTRAVEVAKLPPEQQQRELEQWETQVKQQGMLVRLLAPAVGKVAEATLRSRAELRCAIAAVAAERYRQSKGRWPDNLEALRQAGSLPHVPTDVFDSKPLRLKRLDDGLLIYSIGPDGADNGGFIDPNKLYAPGTDMGFRLWDVSRRRQPPAPPKQADQ